MKCPKCGYANSQDALNCNLCGEILRKASASPPVPVKKGQAPAPEREALSKTETDPHKYRQEASISKDSVETIISPELMEASDQGKPAWFLVCFPLEPVPLSKDRKTIIGRSGECDLILPVGVVSRQHAEIAWSGECFTVLDLNSFNGTFLNDEKVAGRVIKDGDVIRIGPYTIQVRLVVGEIKDMAAAFAPRDKTEIFMAADLVERESSFSGRLGEVKPDELFQLIDFNKKTGTLEVESGGKKGEFQFLDGQLLYADYHHTTGETAVLRVLTLATGSFQFKAGPPRSERNVFEPTSRILLNAMRRKDEFSR